MTSFPESAGKFLGDIFRNNIEMSEPNSQKQTRIDNPNRTRSQTSLLQTEDPGVAPAGYVQIIPIGHITAYFEKIQVAVIKLEKPLRLGDLIQITAKEMLFQQPVDSMQINRKPVKIGRIGSEIGLKVMQEPEMGGLVYKVSI